MGLGLNKFKEETFPFRAVFGKDKLFRRITGAAKREDNDSVRNKFKNLIHCAVSGSCSKRFFSNYNVEPFILIRDSAVVFPLTSISQIIFQL